MNLILLFDKDFISPGRVRLKGRRLRHVREVHRALVGDELYVGMADGLMGSGRILSIGSDCLEMDVTLDRQPPPALQTTLIMALPRPKVLKRILISVSAIGVKKIVLLNSYRVEKSFWQSPVLIGENLKKQLILGLEQGCDTILPEVIIRSRFKPFVEDELPEMIAGTLPLVAHPGSPEGCPCNIGRRPVTVAIGPEGGFIPYEIEKLVACGFSAIHLGERLLSVETAVPFILSRVV
jgi:RsmE family RNA methyltransferase